MVKASPSLAPAIGTSMWPPVALTVESDMVIGTDRGSAVPGRRLRTTRQFAAPVSPSIPIDIFLAAGVMGDVLAQPAGTAVVHGSWRPTITRTVPAESTAANVEIAAVDVRDATRV